MTKIAAPSPLGPRAVIRVPFPPAELYPNQVKRAAFMGGSGRTRRAAGKYKREVLAACVAQKGSCWGTFQERIDGSSPLPLSMPLVVKLTFERRKKPGRAPDIDNLVAAAKYGLDVLTDACIWEDDGLIRKLSAEMVVADEDALIIAIEGE